jgi:hypothetical protein
LENQQANRKDKETRLIPAPPGTVARYKFDNNGHPYYDEKPVIAFDGDGRALVAGGRRLVPADDYANFTGLDERAGYVALIPAGGWRVEFSDDDGSKWDEPLAGWALKNSGRIDPFTTDADGLTQNFDSYAGQYRIYHPDTTEITGAPDPSTA